MINRGWGWGSGWDWDRDRDGAGLGQAELAALAELAYVGLHQRLDLGRVDLARLVVADLQQISTIRNYVYWYYTMGVQTLKNF